MERRTGVRKGWRATVGRRASDDEPPAVAMSARSTDAARFDDRT